MSSKDSRIHGRCLLCIIIDFSLGFSLRPFLFDSISNENIIRNYSFIAQTVLPRTFFRSDLGIWPAPSGSFISLSTTLSHMVLSRKFVCRVTKIIFHSLFNDKLISSAAICYHVRNCSGISLPGSFYG